MANDHTLTIPDNPDAILDEYGSSAVIHVESSPTQGGLYWELPTADYAVVTADLTYAILDPNGSATDWYRYRYQASADGGKHSDWVDYQTAHDATVYAALATFKLHIGAGADTTHDALMTLALVAASRAIDRFTNQTWATPYPSGITEACLIQASRIFKRRDAPFGVAGSPEMGNELRLLARLDPDVELLLWDYKHWWSIV